MKIQETKIEQFALQNGAKVTYLNSECALLIFGEIAFYCYPSSSYLYEFALANSILNHENTELKEDEVKNLKYIIFLSLDFDFQQAMSKKFNLPPESIMEERHFQSLIKDNYSLSKLTKVLNEIYTAKPLILAKKIDVSATEEMIKKNENNVSSKKYIKKIAKKSK